MKRKTVLSELNSKSLSGQWTLWPNGLGASLDILFPLILYLKIYSGSNRQVSRNSYMVQHNRVSARHWTTQAWTVECTFICGSERQTGHDITAVWLMWLLGTQIKTWESGKLFRHLSVPQAPLPLSFNPTPKHIGFLFLNIFPIHHFFPSLLLLS